DKNITDLTGVEAMVNLTRLYIQDNQITALNVSNSLNLDRLYMWNNQVSTLDLSANPALTRLYADTNSFSSIDLSNNINLINVALANQQSVNRITSLDVSALVNLEFLSLEHNNIASIDLSNNTELTNLIIFNNQLSAINVAANTKLNYLWLGGDPNDLGGGSETNTLTSLDVTNNIELIELIAAGTQNLTSIDVSSNPDLTLLNVNANNLTSLDVSANNLLSVLAFGGNQISSISLVNNTELVELYAWDDILTSIDLTQNTKLEKLIIPNNQLSDLDISQNLLLKEFDINQVQKTGVLDLSNHLQLESFIIANTLLTGIDLKSGNNTLVYNAEITDNPNLTCVQVDDVTYATNNWTNITNSSVYNADCGYSSANLVAIPDTNFEQALIDLGFDTNGLNGNILESEAQAVTILDVSDPTNNVNLPNVNAKITDLTGIEAFVNITELNCEKNELANLDTSSNLLLTSIKCGFNLIQNIDVSSNTNLDYLNAKANQLSNIDISANTLLEYVSVWNNQLTTLNLSNNTNLEVIFAFDNQISSLDVSNLSKLTQLIIGQNNFSSIDVSNNVLLQQLSMDDNQLTSINVNANTALTSLQVHNNQIATIDVTNNPALTVLFIENNLFTTIDVSQNLNLFNLAIGLNNIAALDVTNNIALGNLTAEGTAISELDLSNNINLEQLWVADNANLTHLDLSHNPLLWNLGVYNTPLESLDLSTNAITKLFAYNMPNLYRLDMSNGNNTNVTDLDITNNASLECISVDDETYATTNWTNIDSGAVFSEDCNGVWTVYTPDENFSTAMAAYITFVDDDNDGLITYEEASGFTGTLDLSNQSIEDITGLEAFSSVTEINLQGNNITDISGLIDSDALILTRNPGEFRTVERKNFSALQVLDCSNNNITHLDVSIIETLTTLNCSNNQLEVLNVKNGNNAILTNFNSTGNPGLYCVLVDNVANANANWTNKDAQTLFSETDCNAKIQPKVFLQGAMLNPIVGEENLMRDDLRTQAVIPATSPYADALTCNASVFNATGADAIVDWIEVSLRDATNPLLILETRSALLQRDGDVVDVDGVSEIAFNLWAKAYYMSFSHRNHLGIMTSTTNVLNFVPSNYNFTDGSIATFGSNAQTNFGVPNGVYALWAGNVNGDAFVQYSGTNPDAPSILSEVLNDSGNFLNFPTHVINGYNNHDINMDGKTQYTGTSPDTPFLLQNVLAHPGNFLNFGTYQIQEQLPEN
ncbi:MAG: hypothetical protein ACPG6B_06125, partial [Oceanihabitans sp.]